MSITSNEGQDSQGISQLVLWGRDLTFVLS